MAICKISKETAAQLYAARSLTGYDRKTKKASIIRQIKRDLGISSSVKIKINILNPDSPEYLLVRNKRTGVVITNNLPEPTVAIPAVASEVPEVPEVAGKKAPVAKTASVAKKVPVAKKVAVAKTAPVAKPLPVAKKAAAAKPLPVAKAPLAKKATQKRLGSPTKSDKYNIEVRPSISGKKVRLGYASSEAEKGKMIAEHKATL